MFGIDSKKIRIRSQSQLPCRNFDVNASWWQLKMTACDLLVLLRHLLPLQSSRHRAGTLHWKLYGIGGKIVHRAAMDAEIQLHSLQENRKAAAGNRATSPSVLIRLSATALHQIGCMDIVAAEESAAAKQLKCTFELLHCARKCRQTAIRRCPLPWLMLMSITAAWKQTVIAESASS